MELSSCLDPTEKASCYFSAALRWRERDWDGPHVLAVSLRRHEKVHSWLAVMVDASGRQGAIYRRVGQCIHRTDVSGQYQGIS